MKRGRRSTNGFFYRLKAVHREENESGLRYLGATAALQSAGGALLERRCCAANKWVMMRVRSLDQGRGDEDEWNAR